MGITSCFSYFNRLTGLVVNASISEAEDPRFESRLQQDFSGSSHTSDIKIGAWLCRISAGTGQPSISIL